VNGRFPRHSRILKTGQFDRVFKSGKKKRVHSLLILYLENPLGYARLGFALSKKRVRHAVQRNRVKRVVRESFRRHRDILPALDIVVVAGANLAACENEMISADFTAFMQQQCKKYSSV